MLSSRPLVEAQTDILDWREASGEAPLIAIAFSLGQSEPSCTERIPYRGAFLFRVPRLRVP